MKVLKQVKKEKAILEKELNIKSIFENEERIDLCTQHIIKNNEDIQNFNKLLEDMNLSGDSQNSSPQFSSIQKDWKNKRLLRPTSNFRGELKLESESELQIIKRK